MLIAESQAEKQEFDGKLTRWLEDPVVAGLGRAIAAREAAQQKHFEEKLRSITLEKNMSNCRLQEKTEACERMSATIYNSDETIATLTDANQKLKNTLAAVQKNSRDLARRCSKASEKDIPDLQMHGLCLLTQKTYFAPVEAKGRARSRSPRRSEDVD